MFVIKVILRFEIYGPALSGLKLLDVLVVSLSVLMSSAVFWLARRKVNNVLRIFFLNTERDETVIG